MSSSYVKNYQAQPQHNIKCKKCNVNAVLKGQISHLDIMVKNISQLHFI